MEYDRASFVIEKDTYGAIVSRIKRFNETTKKNTKMTVSPTKSEDKRNKKERKIDQLKGMINYASPDPNKQNTLLFQKRQMIKSNSNQNYETDMDCPIKDVFVLTSLKKRAFDNPIEKCPLTKSVVSLYTRRLNKNSPLELFKFYFVLNGIFCPPLRYNLPTKKATKNLLLEETDKKSKNKKYFKFEFNDNNETFKL